jgi:hypothetical protein
MPKRKQNKQPARKLAPKCIHEYIKSDGSTTCSKCTLKSISYLTPLPN